MLAFFCFGARYRPWRYFAALHSRVFGDGAAPRRTRCSLQPCQHSVFRASGGGVLQVLPSAPFFCGEGGSYLVRGESRRSSMARSSRMRSRATGSGNILARCVPGRPSVTIFSPHASRKWPRTGKSPVRGSISPPCIQNELALAGCARYASEKPRKPPFGNAPREDLAMKGPLSLHGPLESCTAREYCHPLQRQTARAPVTPAPPNSASRQS